MKDPCFNFYSADFMQGVSDLTMEERGMFITMLCLQHQKGELTEKTIRLNVGNPTQDVLDKFRITESGSLVNDRLIFEVNKKAVFNESRRKNGQKGGRPSEKEPKTTYNNLKETDRLLFAKPTNNLIENENENEKEIEKEYKGVQGENENYTNSEKSENPILATTDRPHHKDVHDPQSGQFVKTKTADVAKLVPAPKSFAQMPEEYNILLMNLSWTVDTLEMVYHLWVASYEAQEIPNAVNAGQAKALFKKFAHNFRANHPEYDKNAQVKRMNGKVVNGATRETVYH